MGIKELQDRRSFLINEEDSLMNELNANTKSINKQSNVERIASIRAELSAIQKASSSSWCWSNCISDR